MKIEIELPKHPSPKMMADATIDHDEWLAALYKDNKQTIAEIDRIAGTGTADEVMKRIAHVIFPMLRSSFELGAREERRRMAEHLVGLGKRAFSNGAPVRAGVLNDMAIELLESIK